MGLISSLKSNLQISKKQQSWSSINLSKLAALSLFRHPVKLHASLMSLISDTSSSTAHLSTDKKSTSTGSNWPNFQLRDSSTVLDLKPLAKLGLLPILMHNGLNQHGLKRLFRKQLGEI